MTKLLLFILSYLSLFNLSSTINFINNFNSCNDDSPYCSSLRQLLSDESTPIVEVLCIVDYDTYVKLESRKNNVKNYFKTFWNNVDHYFKPIGIRISLVNVIIADTPLDMQYLEKHRLYQNYNYDSGFAIDTYNVLNDAKEYIYLNYNTTKIPPHDVAIIITQSKLCSKIDSTGEICTSYQSNYTTSDKKICSIDDKKKLSNSLAIVRDEGTIYKGVKRSVIAIGSLLGGTIDKSMNLNCKNLDDKFMSTLDDDDNPNIFNWSNCSIKLINNFLNSPLRKASCLYFDVKISTININNEKLPGQKISLSEYCDSLYKSSIPVKMDSSVCTELICNYKIQIGSLMTTNDKPVYVYKNITGPALEGSWCHTGKRCFYGKCVESSE